MKWKHIAYAERDPLDHHMTSGHVAYRLRFKTSATYASIVLNVRHVAMMWCNGQVVGRQLCYSHNACSAGSMHAVDLHHAGRKRHNLTPALRNSAEARERGYHEVIILVFSCGQSRSPFLINDVRNKRGLLSAALKVRGRVSDLQWYIAGVDVTVGDDSYGSSGLPFEEDANDFMFDHGFAPVDALDISADKGVHYYRSTFKVPANAVVGGTCATLCASRFSRRQAWSPCCGLTGCLLVVTSQILAHSRTFMCPRASLRSARRTRLSLLLTGILTRRCQSRFFRGLCRRCQEIWMKRTVKCSRCARRASD